MTQELINSKSIADIFSQYQETFEEAKKKSSEESGSRIPYLRFSQDGTYSVRVLPLAPVINSNGEYALERKGYEYPIKELILKIEDPNTLVGGKPKSVYISTCNAKYAFPNLPSDLIDKYVSVACNLHADDEAFCKKLKETSFNGGLKWDSRRCLYVFDLDKPAEGLKILQLSYSQYKDLEERKLKLWEKLAKTTKCSCPISSVGAVFPLEITRKTEGKKTEYSINIDTITKLDALSESELDGLLNAPRLPEVIYRYTRFHLEATIAFLTQLDERMGVSVMATKEIEECIEQIKLSLPADDHSHFTFGGIAQTNNTPASSVKSIDDLWDAWNKIDEAGLDDKSEEGQNLRAMIAEFIEEKDLNVRVSRTKSNLDLLNDIDDELNSPAPAEEEEEDDEPATVSAAPAEEEEEDDEPAEPAYTPSAVRRQRNDDTNEPAAQLDRRAARPARRRL